MPSSPQKETIYIDLEDEITTIIDKVEAGREKIVALVLPKRATALQSIVNMRLLKRSADGNKKQVVLITSEAGLLPLAGAAGLYVAKSLNSKPVLPPSPDSESKTEDEVENITESDTEEVGADNQLDPNAAVGELALGGAGAEAADGMPETIELDDEPAAPDSKGAKQAKPKKDKSLIVPNFDKFRWLLIGGIAAFILLIVFLVWAIKVAPHAKVNIVTDSTDITANFSGGTLSSAKTLDEANNILPAVSKQSKQVGTDSAPATGQKDIGTKSSGSVTISTSCSPSVPTIPAGTTASANGLSFITQSDVSLSTTSVSGGKCVFSGEVTVLAAQSGAQYNLGPRSDYTVSGYPSASASDSKGMAGGTSNVVKVIAQTDVDGAKAKIASKQPQAANASADFYKQLETSGLYVFKDTGTTSEPAVTASPNVGEQGDSVTVTQTITYTVLTVQKGDFAKLISNALIKQIDTSKQKLSDGDVINGAAVRVNTKTSDTEINFSVQKKTTAVPIINAEEVKQLAAGKKKLEVRDKLLSRPGVKEVDVSYSPFWVSAVPKDVKKITVNLQQQSSKK